MARAACAVAARALPGRAARRRGPLPGGGVGRPGAGGPRRAAGAGGVPRAVRRRPDRRPRARRLRVARLHRRRHCRPTHSKRARLDRDHCARPRGRDARARGGAAAPLPGAGGRAPEALPVAGEADVGSAYEPARRTPARTPRCPSVLAAREQTTFDDAARRLRIRRSCPPRCAAGSARGPDRRGAAARPDPGDRTRVRGGQGGGVPSEFIFRGLRTLPLRISFR
jgi:hypothetical protein